MFRNFIKSSLRSIVKNRVYSMISVFGLAVALSSSFLIVQYIDFEQSYDSYHKHADRIYRIETSLTSEGNQSKTAGSYMGFSFEGPKAIPEIVHAFSSLVDLSEYSQLTYEVNGSMQSVKLNKFHHVTQSIFDVFSFDVIEGSLENALTGTTKAVITRSLAERIYGSNFSAVGKTIYSNNDVVQPFEIAAVVEDQPENSHFKLEFMAPMALFKAQYPQIYESSMWSWLNRYNYIVIETGANKQAVEGKLNELLAQHSQEQTGKPALEITLKAVKDIHLNSNLSNEHEAGGDARTVRILSLIAVLIILVAYANYINLTTSINLRRAKEVGIRKVVGSSRKLLITQFLLESVMITSFSLVVSILFVFLGRGYLSWIIEHYPDLYLLSRTDFWAIGLSSLILLSVLASIYPALVITNLKTVSILKGVFFKSKKGAFLHKSLVTLQFSIASILILFTLVVNAQLNFMLDEDLGADINQTVVLKAPPYTAEDNSARLEGFRNEALSNARVVNVSSSTSIPGAAGYSGNIRLLSDNEDELKQISHMLVDEDYLDLFDIKMTAGRSYSRHFAGDQGSALVINEKAAQVLGFDNADDLVGEAIILNGADTLNIIGVARNYHHQSLQQDYEPLAFELSTQYIRYISVKLNSAEIGNTIEQLENAWNQHLQGNVFDFFLADENFNRQYQKEAELKGIVTAFSSGTILIACLGLFALSLFTLINKRKEIGIRKVLGAPSKSLFWSLSREIFMLIGLATLIATPMAYVLVNNWLITFVNRINISIINLLFPVVAILTLALATIGYNVVQSMRANPIDSVRND